MDKESPQPQHHTTASGREDECCFPPYLQHGGLRLRHWVYPRQRRLTLGSGTGCPHENILFRGKPFRHPERCPFVPFLSSANSLGATRIGSIRLEPQQVLAFLGMDQEHVLWRSAKASTLWWCLPTPHRYTSQNIQVPDIQSRNNIGKAGGDSEERKNDGLKSRGTEGPLRNSHRKM